MFNISKREINDHIKKLTKEDITKFTSKYNIYLNKSELDFIHSFVKNNSQSIINNPKNFDLNLYKDKFSIDNYNKLNKLYNKYSNYLSLINLTD